MADSEVSTSKSGPLSKQDIFAALGMGALLILVLVRALSMHEPFPMWNADPYLISATISGITDGYASLLNLLMIALSLLVFILSNSVHSRLDSVSMVCMGVGFLGIAYHLNSNIEHAVNGLTLASMLAVLLSTRAFIARYPCWNRVLIPIALGVGCLMAVYGFHQILIQHPLTVETYEEGRAAFLAARGWTDGSFEQLSFERRLNQAEATGWFGLSNVFASFMGAISIAFFTIGLASLKRSWWILCMLVGGVFFGLLVMSKSKGGIGAALLGFGVIQYTLARPSGRPNRLGTSALSSCGLVIIGIFAGSLLQQLSLVFRSQYIVGSLKIFAENPIFGSGPNGFQGAYMIHKPATSPEDVTSAHNLFFDLLGQLGVFGILMIAALVMVILSASIPRKASAGSSDSAAETKPAVALSNRIIIRIIALIVIFSGISMIRIQTGALNLDLMIMLLLGTLLWGITSVLLAVLSDLRTLRLAASSAAAVLLIHSMLDVTPVWVVSAPLFGLFLGLGLVPSQNEAVGSSSSKFEHRMPIGVVSIGFLAVMVIGGLSSMKLIERDRTLINLARPANEILELRTSFQINGATQDLTQSISGLIGQQVPTNGPAISQVLNQLELESRVSTADELRALSGRMNDSKLRVAALEQTMKAATYLDFAGLTQDSGELWLIVEHMASDLEAQGSTFRELNWAGQSYQALGERAAIDPSQRSMYQQRAIKVWEQADLLNPNDPKNAVRIMDAYNEAGDTVNAGKWAQEALDRSGRMKLDPLKELRGGVLDRVRALAEG